MYILCLINVSSPEDRRDIELLVVGLGGLQATRLVQSLQTSTVIQPVLEGLQRELRRILHRMQHACRTRERELQRQRELLWEQEPALQRKLEEIIVRGTRRKRRRPNGDP